MSATVGVVKSFWTAMGKLPQADLRAAAAFAEKFQENPANPGISLEQVKRAKDKNIRSARISGGARAIVYHGTGEWLLLYVGAHDDAYAWAENKRIKAHETTGALQIYDLPEVAAPAESVAGPWQTAAQRKDCLFDKCVESYLLGVGVPEEWLTKVRSLETQDDLLALIDHLPEPVAERLVRMANGEHVPELPPAQPNVPPTESEDFRRVCLLQDQTDELRHLLQSPTSLWIAYLHPSQRKLATGSFSGPLKVTGTAGTGKTVVALHRARHHARSGKKVLLTSFVTTLCENLDTNLRLVCSPEELARITVTNVHKIARELYVKQGGKLSPDNDVFKQILEAACKAAKCPFDVPMVEEEWKAIVEAQGIETWDGYRGASRAGRGQAISVAERKLLWDVFERTRDAHRSRGLISFAEMCREARKALAEGRVASPFDSIIVDEVQDLGPEELRFLAALAGPGPDRLALVGDGGQRIYAGKLTFRSLGIDVRGRSHVLKITYRTSEEIRRFAERILDGKADDLDGADESRAETVALFSGPKPALKGFASPTEEAAWIAEQIDDAGEHGVGYEEIAVFARSNKGVLDEVEKALGKLGIPCMRLKPDFGAPPGTVRLGTMHRAKGLEFKIVHVAGAGDGQIPHAKSLPDTKDAQLRNESMQRERQLLYVSVTRARNVVTITWSGKASPLLPKTAPEASN